jgi:PPOX class probable F420-dependent enzyme
MPEVGGQPSLPSDVRRFLAEAGRFAVVATINADGTPHQAVAWYLLDGDSLVLNSMVGRRWPANLMREPHVSVLVADGYRWVSLRGAVQVVSDRARAQADIAAMARSYHADDPGAAEREIRTFETQERVTFVLRAARVAADLEE